MKGKKKFVPKHEIVNGRLSCGIMHCPRDLHFFLAYFKAQAAAREANDHIGEWWNQASSVEAVE